MPSIGAKVSSDLDEASSAPGDHLMILSLPPKRRSRARHGREVKKRLRRRRGARGHPASSFIGAQRGSGRRAPLGRRAGVADDGRDGRGDRRRPGVARPRGLRGYTGRGIGVAVIDSGMAPHNVAARTGVVASLDFTGGVGAVDDDYGHGTHVAGIIAGSDDDGVRRRSRRARTSSPCMCSARTARATRATSSRRSTGRSTNRASIQHPRHQPLARASGASSPIATIRCARRSQRAVDAGHRRGGRGGQPRQDGGRPADRRRRRLAGQLAGGADRRRDQHERARRCGPTT